jgi:hypothetical protein
MIKATTSHGTYYIIDTGNYCAKRVKAEGRGNMYGDGKWFHYSSLNAIENGEAEGEIEVGKSMMFVLTGPRSYDWIATTPVVSIEEYDG